MSLTIRAAQTRDSNAMQALLPALADFDVPAGRNPDHLWHGDREMLLQWLDGKAPMTFVLVAVDKSDAVMGTAIVTLREELLSHEPSSHLEVLVVNPQAHRQGVGKALISACEEEAKSRGAGSMSLHVFSNNTRARGLYEKCGFDGELMRYYKPL